MQKFFAFSPLITKAIHQNRRGARRNYILAVQMNADKTKPTAAISFALFLSAFICVHLRPIMFFSSSHSGSGLCLSI
jgi:hypothetical protein